jgi:hypothetical protein
VERLKMATLIHGVAIFLVFLHRVVFKRSAMIRWIVFLLLTGCMAAQTGGTPTQNTPQGHAAEQTPAARPEATTATTDGFPFDPFPEFSAIMVGSVVPGDDREAHIYRSGHLLRTQGTEGFVYYLTDLTSFETYAINSLGCTSDSHVYFRAFPFSSNRPKRKIERVKAGTESVDGHMCQVEEVTVSGGDLTMPMRLKFWEAEDLHGFPIKVQVLKGKSQNIIQYKDVVLGPPDPTLFMRPKLCKGGLPHREDQAPAKKKKSHPATKSR